jgi:DNA-binding GntR family transcriptional regulator
VPAASGPSPLAAIVDAARPRFRTAVEFVEEALREAILSGAIAGGTALRQEELAATFRTSRMPVREALRRLEAQALVDFYPHRGAVVADVTAAEAADNLAIRAALEPMALKLSLPHLTAADLDAAEALAEAMDDGGAIAEAGDLNRRFHMTLYGRAGRPRLLTLVEQHLAASERFIRFAYANLGERQRSAAEHRAMVEACRAGDGKRACAVLARHIEGAGDRYLAFLSVRAGD